MSPLYNEIKVMALLACVTLALAGCGLFGGPPGKAACNQFKKTVIDWRQGDLNYLEFRKELGQISDKAASAEPDIQVAAERLLRATGNVSEDRLEVSIDIMGEACAELGYLSQYTF